jgi:hypothetical protein
MLGEEMSSGEWCAAVRADTASHAPLSRVPTGGSSIDGIVHTGHALVTVHNAAYSRRVHGAWNRARRTPQVTRIVVFGDDVAERLKDATAIVRRAWRAGERTGPERMLASSEMLFTLLPEALRDAVLAHFGVGTVTGAVGTVVGTNESAAGISDSGGAVPR